MKKPESPTEAGINKLLRAGFGPIDERADGNPVLQSLLKEQGLDWIVDELIMLVGLDPIRAVLKSRKKSPGRKRKVFTAPGIDELFVYYAIEHERNGKTVSSTCARLARQTATDQGTLRNRYNKGKQMLSSKNPDIRYLIESIERWDSGRSFAGIYFAKKLPKN